MLKFVITTKEDLREAAKLQARRQYEEERKARIFNGRQRLYGLDYEALQKQITEKSLKEQLEAERERKYTDEVRRQSNLLKAQEIEQQKLVRARNSDLNYYRCRFQRKDSTREFDLNDPNIIHTGEPVRLADDDPRLGISSAQVFVGEDLHFLERKRAQRDQQRAWLDQQMKERKQAEQDRMTADKIMQDSLNAVDKRLMDMAVSERENQAKIKESILRFNQSLAYEKSEGRKMQKKHTQEDDLAEIYNMLTSDMLTENPEVAESKVHLNKKIAFMYRGMTPEEIQVFRDEQVRQLEQNKKKKDEEKMMEKIWEQHAINMAKELTLKHMEQEKIVKAQLEEQRKANMALAEEQRARKEYMDKVVYRNQATEEYWGQFNRTTR